MSSKKHKDEIIRWANSHEGTRVWNKGPASRWQLIDNPRWTKDTKYIVDDRWSELRKAQEDGTQLQRFDGEVWFTCALRDYAVANDTPKEWRIKPKPVYEYQWVIHHTINDRFQFTEYMTEEETEGANYIVKRYEPSKRIRR